MLQNIWNVVKVQHLVLSSIRHSSQDGSVYLLEVSPKSSLSFFVYFIEGSLGEHRVT